MGRAVLPARACLPWCPKWKCGSPPLLQPYTRTPSGLVPVRRHISCMAAVAAWWLVKRRTFAPCLTAAVMVAGIVVAFRRGGLTGPVSPPTRPMSRRLTAGAARVVLYPSAPPRSRQPKGTTTMTTTQPTTDLRKADLTALHARLTDEQTRKHDFVAPATALSVKAGQLVVAGSEPEIGDSGVTSFDGTYDLNSVAVEGLAAKLDIPLGYLRRNQAKNLSLFDDNVNGWLGHSDYAGKRYLVRTL